ncbi:MAG: ABC transporter ATP-binding protein [Chloroflexi bacterium]|nr:ABC transporter ATP-binding protein [Chloroflexota bacterium]
MSALLRAGNAAAPSPALGDVVLALEGLTKRYGDLVAVDAISFEVQQGEIFGILGPNGAGKTTTLEMIEGLRTPDAGRITLLGLDAVRQRRKVQERIGVQLQSQALWPELRVDETLKVFGALFPRRLSVDSMVERFALAEKRRSLVKDLSGGQKQRLSVATALVNDPEVVFLGLLALPAVSHVRQDNGPHTLFSHDAAATLAGLMDLSGKNGAQVKDLHVRTATLEDVFISLTGRRLRD